MTFSQKQYDAGRMTQQSAKGNMYHTRHPEYNRDRMRLHRQRLQEGGFGNYISLIDQARNPLNLNIDEPFISASDWHVPFIDWELTGKLMELAEMLGIKVLVIPGDFWDCDNYSKHIQMTHKETFKTEIENVRFMLNMLTEQFDKIYFCRGNHEKRYIDLNGGHIGMQELFYQTGIIDGYEVTQDDHMYITHQGERWLFCHPRNYRITNLSVARDLAAKYQCSTFVAHGHQWAQGYDRSGKFRLIDGGGMFDKQALEYLRETSCYPETRSGFYLFMDGEIYPVEGK